MIDEEERGEKIEEGEREGEVEQQPPAMTCVKRQMLPAKSTSCTKLHASCNMDQVINPMAIVTCPMANDK